MEELRELLLHEDNSEIARVLRHALVGLRACLDDAASRSVADVGAASCARVLNTLDDLLADRPSRPAAGTGAERGEAGPAALRGHPDLPDLPDLRKLVTAFAADESVQAHLERGSLAVFSADVPAQTLWGALHLRLLRLPRPLADSWRERAAALAPRSDQSTWTTLPAETAEVLIPPFPPGGTGLRTSPMAECDPAVLAALGIGVSAMPVPTAGNDTRYDPGLVIARVATTVAHLAGMDDQLRLCLASIDFRAAIRISPTTLAKYRDALLTRLRYLAQYDAGSTRSLLALVDVDEAVHSLVHPQPAAPTSWWAAACQPVRRLVAARERALRSAGADVETSALTGLRYRELDGRTDNDVSTKVGGIPGDVVACLRMWVRDGDRTVPGRVVYRM